MRDGVTSVEQTGLRIHVFGPLRLLDPNGIDHTPISAKARGVLALLALGPPLGRSRAWLQDKLWSRQDHEQGSANLRQALSAIRKALGEHRDAIQATAGMLSLDLDIITVEHATDGSQTAFVSTFSNRRELLEGLEINDPEFNEWLRDQRLALEPATDQPEAGSRAPTDIDVTSSIRLFSKPADHDAAPLSTLAEIIGDSISQSIGHTGSVELRQMPMTNGHLQFNRTDIVLQTNASSAGGNTSVRVKLESAFNGTTLWTGFRTVDTSEHSSPSALPIQKLMNQAVDVALERYKQLCATGNAKNLPAILCFDAVKKMFQLGHDNIQDADQLLADAYDIDPKGIYLGWRAYLRIIQLGEKLTNDKQAAAGEAMGFVRMALEKDPGNPMVLTLSSYIQTMVFRNYHAAFELAKEALQYCHFNPLSWAFLGIARMHLGEAELGYQNALHARAISGPGPHKYQLDMLACQTAAVAGHFDDAIRFGKSSHAMAPGYAPPLRYLAALMINAGRTEDAELVLADLRNIEPEFSFDLMLDSAYPSAALRKSKLTQALTKLPASKRI